MAALDHAMDELRGADGGAEHVDSETPAPIVGFLLPRLASASGGHAGVVVQQVDLPVAVIDRIGECLHRVLIGDVSLHPPDVAVAVHLSHGVVDRRLFDVGNDDLRAVAQQCTDDALADARRPAGDDSDRVADDDVLEDGGLVLGLFAHATTSSRWLSGFMRAALGPPGISE